MKKRAFSLLLAALMCLGILSSFTAIAAEEVSEFEYFYKENFNNLDSLPAPKRLGGLTPLNAYKSMTSVMNGALNLVYMNNGNEQGLLDLQFWVTDFQKISTDFTLFLRLKPTATWNRSNKDFFGFRYRNEAESSSWHHLFNTVDGKISMTTDSGEVQTPVLPLDSYTTLEWMFHSTDTVFTSVDFYMNGEKIGTKILEDAKLTAIDQFRMFAAYDVMMGTIMIDEYALIKGTKSHNGIAIPDNEAEQIPVIEPIPEVAPDQLTWREYFYYEDFSGETIYSAPSPDSPSLMESNGFWLNNGNLDSNWVLENGTLGFKGAEFLDLQFYIVRNYKVKEDFVLSFKFKPHTGDLFTEHLIDWRRDSEGVMDTKNIQIIDGYIYADDKNCGKLPVDQWTLIEVMFDYDETLKEFTSYTLMLNGKAMATGALSSDSILTQIKHFRMFRYLKSYTFEIDEICVLAGNTSSIYAMSYGTPKPDDSNGNENEDVTGEVTGDPTVTDPAVTDAPATNAPATNEQTAAPGTSASTTEAPKTEKGGCGASVVSLSVIAVIALGGVMLRKKED
ncbi:MAG: hypothetical protein E7620_00250 [Ruminococcaceae bacterium]|nr:hypothetical protein [Oscillospiraceae bacterium]